MAWPAGIERIPTELSARNGPDAFALAYDQVGTHGWYANLDPTAAAVVGRAQPGEMVMDYSGGTGLLGDRVLGRLGDMAWLNVDASQKLLRLAVAKHGNDPRCGFRLLHPLPAGGLEPLDLALGSALRRRGVDHVVCANAVHLYPDPEATFHAWAQACRPGAWVHVQSGNILPDEGRGRTIDSTVEAAHKAALRIAAQASRWKPYLAELTPERRAAYDALRRRYFLPPRRLRPYVQALAAAGFRLAPPTRRPIQVERAQWRDFLLAYADGILGWVGGVDKVEGRPPTPQALQDRRDLLVAALDEALPERFEVDWHYIEGRLEAPTAVAGAR